MKTFRIVNYACNGIGMGHVTRLLAINRELRTILQQRHVKSEFYFLTTSDADILTAEQFLAFKIPSLKAVEKFGVDLGSFSSIARSWMWNTLDLLKPDLFIVDMLPQGTFWEFSPAFHTDSMHSCKHKALVYRPVLAQVASQPVFQDSLKQYDSIVIPEHQGVDEVYIPSDLLPRTQFFGPVISCNVDNMPDKETARKALDLPLDTTLIYVSAGGGGHQNAEEQLTFICNALADVPNIHLAIAAGPLYSASKTHAKNITWLKMTGISKYLKAFDLAISAAGYNTYHELMHAGIPTIFMPLTLPSDDQTARANRATNAGAAQTLISPTPQELKDQVLKLTDPKINQTMSQNARKMVPQNYAKNIAEHLAGLLLDDILEEEMQQQSAAFF